MNIAVNGSGGMLPGASGNAAGAGTAKASSGLYGANKKKNEWKRKKDLNYNPREISGQLVRAKKSRNAAVVLIRAKRRLAMLNNAHVSGQYDDAEVRAAIIHAKKMVECSKVKVRNLKEEEILKSRNDREKDSGERKKRNEVRKRVRKKEREVQVRKALEENRRLLKEKSMQQELLRKRRMHRDDEMRKITEADLEYLEDQMKNNQGSNSTRYDGVALDLSGTAMQLSELKMTEQQLEQQIEAEVEIQVEAEMAMDAGSFSSVPGSAASVSPSADMGGAEAVSLDVSV